MAKQLNVSLAFTADTSKAKKEIQNLQTQLTQLINSVGTNKQLTGLNSEIQKSVSAAAKLKVQLESATNVDTGKLDLGKFNDALNKGGINLKQYQSLLSNLGSAGDQAFASLTKSIMNAEVPLKRSSTLLTEFATTLKNTARWQISSSILHGFMGSISSAYRYAQDLNQSLNNIRIVTGYNTDQMAKFADQANRAAQSLSTTTTSYTDAALIYYQQGIRDQEEIAGRTETTIKLANVSRQSAEEVSSQMTAIWNNFDDGSKSLEYYADVITALGANTAASSEEIASGMSKFAAVAETVGLSYEYAASSLATIVATTRQSEDTVGTGLRTIFSRLEGLKLGETLEDGVDLNKYSAALKTVGVDILDATGQLKQMDDILDETAQHWDNLDRAQKVAFATTVGGVRQYTNLIALLDNWDMMQENVGIAKGSEGALQEQADIYAESWEAAEKRVRAAAEAIYSDLINDDFFITILNGFEKILQEVDIFIDSMGGLKGAISIVGAALMTVFNKDIATNLDNMIYSISMMTSAGRAKVEGRRQEAINALINTSANGITDSETAAADVYKNQAQSQQLLLDNNDRLSEQERQQVQLLLDQQEILGQQVIESAKLVEQTRNKSNELTAETRNYADKGDNKFDSSKYNEQSQALREATKKYIEQKNAKQELLRISKSESKNISELEQAYNQYSSKITLTTDQKNALNQARAQGVEAYKQELQNIAQSVTSTKEYADAEKALAQTIQEGGTSEKDAAASARDLRNAYMEEAQAVEGQRQANENLKGSYQSIAETIQNAKGHFLSTGEAISLGAQQIMALSMAINALKGLGNIWSNEDLSIGEKILQTVSTLAITVPMLTSAFNAEKIAKMSSFMASQLLGISYSSLTIASEAEAMATLDQTKDQALLNAARIAGIPVTAETTRGELAAALAKEVEHGVNLKLVSSQILLNAQFWLAVAAIAAVVAITYSLVKAYNKSADDAKKASEAANGLKEQYQKTKESYEELKKSIEDHENAVKAIDKLKHGTEEWRDAIQEANEKVLELIGNYPQLAAAVSRNKDGILTIDENSSAYKSYMSEAEDQMRAASYGSLGGKVLSNEANYNNDLVQASRTITYQSGNSAKEGHNLYRQVSPEELRKAVELYNKDAGSFNRDSLMEALNTSNENLCQALIDNTSQIAELSAELSANTSANELAAQEIGMSELAKNNPNVKDEYIQAVGGMLGDQFTQELNKQNYLWEDRGVSSYHSDKEAQQKYAESMGYTWDKNLGGNKGRYLDKEGNVKDIPDSVARTFLAVQDATAAISKNLDSAQQAILDLQKGSQNLSNLLGKDSDPLSLLLSGKGGNDLNLSSLTEEQFANFRKAWDEAAGEDHKLSAEELQSYFGISDEFAQSLGYKNGAAFAQAMAHGIDNYADDVKQAFYDSLSFASIDEEGARNLFTSTNKAIDSVSSGKEIDEETYNGMSGNLQEFFDKTLDGTYKLKTGAEELFNTVADSEKLSGFTENLKAMDQQIDMLTAAKNLKSYIDEQSKVDQNIGLRQKMDYAAMSGNMEAGDVQKYSTELDAAQNGGGPMSAESIQAIEDAYKSAIETVRDYDKEIENIKKDQEELQKSIDIQKIKDFDSALDKDVDSDQYKALSKHIQETADSSEELADSLKKDELAAKKVSSEMLRYDSAIAKIQKDYNKWQQALESGTMQDHVEAAAELSNVYGDLLNIDGSSLSDGFLTSIDNLKDLQDAANGSEEAYNRLVEAAQQDILAQCDLDTTRFDAAKASLDTALDELNFKDLEIGAELNTDQALQAMTELVNAAGMTQQQATDYLSAMGVDAEVETVSEEEPVNKTINDLVPQISYDKSADVPTVAGDGTTSSVPMPVPTIKYTADPHAIEDTTAGGGFSLKVTSANKSSGGGYKHKHSSHGSGSGRGGGGGRRGGGGGGGREFRKIDRTEKDEKQKKKAEDEIERYHKVRNELQDIEKELSLIGKAKDRAFGRNKIRQIDAETASLKKQSETQKKYLSEIQGWLEKDNAKAKEFGFEINGEGLVTNYEENMKKLIDKVNSDYDDYIAKLNALEDAYNAAGVDDEDSKKKLEDDKKALAKEWEANQKYYEDAKEALSKQEETHDLLIEQQEALQDMLNNIYDNGITKITYVVELKVDVADRDIALLQDYLEDIGDKADGASDAIANFGNQLEKVLEKTDAYTQGVADILQHADADEDLIDSILNHTFDENDWDEVLSIGQDGKGLNEEEIQYLKDAADALLSHNQELRELREQALEKTSEAFEEFNEQLDRGVVKIEHLTTVTQTYRDVLDIVGKDVLDRNGKLTDALNKQTYNIQRNHTHALQSQLDFIDTALEKAKGLYDEAVQNGYNQKTLESLKADVEKYEDERQATYEEWLDSWREECQIAKDYYEDTLNQILQDFEDVVAGQFKNLSGLSEEFARKNEIADIYVEDYEKIYQLSKLNRDINKSLDDSTTLASKAKLRDIQKEINDLQESGVEVSQYDLDVLRKKYEMALAYEQWQDAQNAKTVVRMQRDNEGNYGYVYTADQADVEAAEQNYEDKLHEMQVLNAEYIQSLQEQIIQAQQDCADALANLRAEDFASYEEYQDAVEQIRKDYTKRVETLSQQMGNAMDNNRTLYEQDWTAYSQATGYKISADEDYIDKFNETVYSQLTGFQTMEEAQNAFVEAVNDASDLAAQNWEDWYVRTNTALDDAGMSMQNYADEVGDTVEQLGEEAERAEEDVWNMSEEFSDAYSTISDTVGDFLDEYSNYIDSMIDANQALIDSINQVIRAYAELHGLEDDDEDDEVRKSEDLEWQEQKDANGVSTGWKVYDKKNKKYLTGKNKIAWAGDDYIQGYTADYDIDEQGNVKQQSENNTLGSGFFGTNFTEEQKAKLRKPQIIKAEINMTDDEKKYGPGGASIKAEITGAATGMYTGDWGDNSGKLAVLHKKELVLNADDTENILSAVDMIRSISKTIDLNAIAAGSIFASPNSAYKSSFGSRDSLEQNVHIQAEFPNVSDHNEIEEALNNLVERAAQFAGRKNL